MDHDMDNALRCDVPRAAVNGRLPVCTVKNEGAETRYLVALGPKGVETAGSLSILVVEPGETVVVFGEWKWGRLVPLKAKKEIA